MTLFLISLVGAGGCLVRYLMEYAVRRHHPTNRPWATVAANALGCGIAGYCGTGSSAAPINTYATSSSPDSAGD